MGACTSTSTSARAAGGVDRFPLQSLDELGKWTEQKEVSPLFKEGKLSSNQQSMLVAGPGATNGLCGSDYDQYQCKMKLQASGKLPIIPGHEPVGWIERAGARAAKRWNVREGDLNMTGAA